MKTQRSFIGGSTSFEPSMHDTGNIGDRQSREKETFPCPPFSQIRKLWWLKTRWGREMARKTV